MSLKNLKIFLMAITAFIAFSQASAQDTTTITVTKVFSDSTTVSRTFKDMKAAQRWAESGSYSQLADADLKPVRTSPSNFMMGAELGTGLDLSGMDLSTFNIDFLFGYRGRAIQLLGVGAGLHKSLGSRDSFIPLQVVFRTGFSSRQTLAFMHVSAGYSFNTVSSSPMFGDVTATIGGGINLVQKPKFQSNITLSFGFRHFSERHQELAQVFKPNVGFVQIAMGISM
ncbi:MAG: hypothetical protein K2J15_01160 [Muribaculaceae bacterium]|nr:hypothetical protein [Muribaculaceae bacterium]